MTGSEKPLTGTLYSRSIYPNTTSTYSLGTNDNKWSSIYVNNIYGSLYNTLTIGPTSSYISSTDKIYNASSNVSIYSPNQNLNNGASPTFGIVSATTFSGALNGNATSATNLLDSSGESHTYVDVISNNAFKKIYRLTYGSQRQTTSDWIKIGAVPVS